MTDCAIKNDFDLQVAEDLLILAQLRESMKYMDNNSIEYVVHCEEIKKKESILKLATRQSKNLKLFCAELYSHGVRHWAYNKCFMAHNEAVHKNRQPEHFIYVPMWAVVEKFGLPSGCGNSNQRQLNNRCSLYFGREREGKIIQIHNETGLFTSYLPDRAPFDINDNVTYWTKR